MMFGQRKIHRVNNAVFTESYWIMQWLIFFLANWLCLFSKSLMHPNWISRRRWSLLNVIRKGEAHSPSKCRGILPSQNHYYPNNVFLNQLSAPMTWKRAGAFASKVMYLRPLVTALFYGDEFEFVVAICRWVMPSWRFVIGWIWHHLLHFLLADVLLYDYCFLMHCIYYFRFEYHSGAGDHD